MSTFALTQTSINVGEGKGLFKYYIIMFRGAGVKPK